MRKKLMSLLLAFVMVFSVLPTFAHAEVAAEATEPAAVEAPAEATAQPEATANTEETTPVELKSPEVVAGPKGAPIQVESLTLSPKELVMVKGETKTLTPKVEPVDATFSTVSWHSDKQEVATVDSSGKVKAEAPGTATITAEAGGKMATATITVYDVPTAITVEPTVTLKVGETKTVTVTVEPEGANQTVIVETIENPESASYNKGTIKGLKEGKTKVFLVSKDNKEVKAEITITVESADPVVVESVEITPGTKQEMRVGDTKTFTAKVLPADVSQGVIWFTSDSAIAEVNNFGKVTAKAEGTAVITAFSTLDNSKKDTVNVTVKPALPTPPTPPVTGNIYNVDVYHNKVTGYAPKYSTVKLYKDGVYLGSDVADGLGYFSITNTFGYYDGYYDNGYWYNGKWYEGNKYSGYRYYDLKNYKLQAYSGTTLLDTYYLNNANVHYDYNGYWGWNNYPNYYPNYNTRVYPTSLNLNYANDVVSGYLNSYPNTYVSVYSGGTYLGSGYTNSSGYFNISLNRRVSSLSGLDFFVGNKSAYDESYGDRVYPWSLSVSLYNVNGYYNPNTVVRAYYNGKYVGTATTDSKGYFSISSNFRIYNDSNLKFYSDKKTASTSDTYKTEITIGSGALNKTVNGVTTTTYMDVAAYIKDGRTMLPIRFIAESLGYYVTFNDATRNATFSDGNKVVVINIDSDVFYVDGVKHTFSVKPEIKSGRTMLPISEVGKALGLTHGNKGEGKNIEWDAVNRTVTVTVTKTK